ncbi:MAG: 2-dehydropantoate 2-reductase [Verrucomicrobia bacterium]|nr:MAG: 2-dehydropantoate 2-reductase [Verrucomicrobiota bacterium]
MIDPADSGSNSRIQRIAIVGAGALGLYYGGRLARAGYAVTFLARSDLGALLARDLAISYAEQRHIVNPVRAAATPEEIGPVDLVVIALKATANAALAELLPPLLGPATAVVNLQNGLGVDEAVAAVVGAKRTLGGLCFVCVNRTAPGEAACSHEGYIALGEFFGGPGPRTEAVAEVFRRAGVTTRIADSLLSARWHKLVWNVPFNGLAVAEGGLQSDEILREPGRERRVRALMREVQAIARAEGVRLEDAFLEDNVERTRSMAYKPSTLLDWQAGKALELSPIWGEPLRRASHYGVPTPELLRLYAEMIACAPASLRAG